MKRSRVTYFTVSIGTLVLGVFVYWSDINGFVPESGLLRMTRYWLPSALWLMSLMTMLTCVWFHSTNKSHLIVSTCALLLGLGYECLQYMNIVPGTFCRSDLIALASVGILYLLHIY